MLQTIQIFSSPQKSLPLYEPSTNSNTPDGSSSDEKERTELLFDLETEDQRRCLRNLNEMWLQGTPSRYSEETQAEIDSIEIDVKPKKRAFQNVDEKKKFIEEYTKKKKTELCKNFQLKGSCNFGDKCSFAHGKHELKEKTHLHSNFKTKPCKQLFYEGKCNYGYRCQYLHGETKYVGKFKNFLVTAYRERDIPLRISPTEEEKLENLGNIWGSLKNEDLNLDAFFSRVYQNKRRLGFFKNLTSQRIPAEESLLSPPIEKIKYASTSSNSPSTPKTFNFCPMFINKTNNSNMY